MATPEKPVRAAALRYVKGDTAPALVASGRGHVAEAILQAAEEAGIPVREDGVLVEALAHLELGDQVPRALPGGRRGARVGLPAHGPPRLTQQRGQTPLLHALSPEAPWRRSSPRIRRRGRRR